MAQGYLQKISLIRFMQSSILKVTLKSIWKQAQLEDEL
jgi:hypothetical protein